MIEKKKITIKNDTLNIIKLFNYQTGFAENLPQVHHQLCPRNKKLSNNLFGRLRLCCSR